MRPIFSLGKNGAKDSCKMGIESMACVPTCLPGSLGGVKLFSPVHTAPCSAQQADGLAWLVIYRHGSTQRNGSHHRRLDLHFSSARLRPCWIALMSQIMVGQFRPVWSSSSWFSSSVWSSRFGQFGFNPRSWCKYRSVSGQSNFNASDLYQVHIRTRRMKLRVNRHLKNLINTVDQVNSKRTSTGQPDLLTKLRSRDPQALNSCRTNHRHQNVIQRS